MRVVATLTTRPNYHENFHVCLDSLIEQFDDVYLGLPKCSIKNVPYKKFEYKTVKVIELEEDIGPATKLLAGFIMEKNKSTLIVSVDDDNEYSPGLRKSLEKQRLIDIKKNKNRIISNAGHYIKYWNMGVLGLNGGGISSPDRFYDINETKILTKISGFGGVAYPSSVITDVNEFISFIKKVSKLNKELIYHDDISISAYFSNKNIEIILNPDRKNNVDKFLSKGENNEDFICENINSVLEYSNILKKYFKNNPTKLGTLVGMDLLLIIILTVILILIYRHNFFKKLNSELMESGKKYDN